MLKVYLSNIATSDGLWLAFPLGSQERQAAMGFGAGGTNEIGAVESQMEGLKTHLEGMTLQPGQGIRELEFLDQHTDCMTEREKGIFQAALEIEKPHSVMEIVNLSCNLDKFVLYDGISGHEELGRHVLGSEEMSEKVALYLDYGAAGKSTRAAMPGALRILGMWPAQGRPWSRSMTANFCRSPDMISPASSRPGCIPPIMPQDITGITLFPSPPQMTGLRWQRKSWAGENWMSMRWHISAALFQN